MVITIFAPRRMRMRVNCLGVPFELPYKFHGMTWQQSDIAVLKVRGSNHAVFQDTQKWRKSKQKEHNIDYSKSV